MGIRRRVLEARIAMKICDNPNLEKEFGLKVEYSTETNNSLIHDNRQNYMNAQKYADAHK